MVGVTVQPHEFITGNQGRLGGSHFTAAGYANTGPFFEVNTFICCHYGAHNRFITPIIFFSVRIKARLALSTGAPCNFRIVPASRQTKRQTQRGGV